MENEKLEQAKEILEDELVCQAGTDYCKNKCNEKCSQMVALETIMQELRRLQRENRNLKVGRDGGLDKDKKCCFYEDGNTGKCLGYSYFNNDEPCIYCQTCDAISIKEDD